MTWRVAFHHTHAYPGCRVTIIDRGDGAFAAAEFSDGVVVAATATPLGPDELLVRLAGYRTARGTAIAAKAWVLRRVSGDGWKVAARAAAED